MGWEWLPDSLEWQVYEGWALWLFLHGASLALIIIGLWLIRIGINRAITALSPGPTLSISATIRRLLASGLLLIRPFGNLIATLAVGLTISSLLNLLLFDHYAVLLGLEDRFADRLQVGLRLGIWFAASGLVFVALKYISTPTWLAATLVSLPFIAWNGLTSFFDVEDRSVIWWEEGAVLEKVRTPCEELHAKFARPNDYNQRQIDPAQRERYSDDADALLSQNSLLTGLPAAHCIRVHFATPRLPEASGHPQLPDDYGPLPDEQLHYGIADVSLPLTVDYDAPAREELPDATYNRGLYEILSDAKDEADDCATDSDNALGCEWLRLSRYPFITEVFEFGGETKTRKTHFVSSLTKAVQNTIPAYCRLHPGETFCTQPVKDRPKAALVFVHGFNETFESTIIRAAQLSLDLDLSAEGEMRLTYGRPQGCDPGDTRPECALEEKRIPVRPTLGYGAPVLFTWPNGEETLSYGEDRTLALKSAPYLYEFLTTLIETDGIDEVNIVVHSMGHRVFSNMIEKFVADYLEREWKDDLNAGKTAAKPLKRIRIVHAAGDISNTSYDDIMANVDIRFDERWDEDFTEDDLGNAPYEDRTAYPQITVYTANYDRALVASWILNGAQRIGLTLPPQILYGGVIPKTHPPAGYKTTVNVRGPSMDFMGHGYYSSNRNVLNDMACFFRNDPDTSDQYPGGILSGRDLWPRETRDGRRFYALYGDDMGVPAPYTQRFCKPARARFALADYRAMSAFFDYNYEEFAHQRMENYIRENQCVPTALANAYRARTRDLTQIKTGTFERRIPQRRPPPEPGQDIESSVRDQGSSLLDILLSLMPTKYRLDDPDDLMPIPAELQPTSLTPIIEKDDVGIDPMKHINPEECHPESAELIAMRDEVLKPPPPSSPPIEMPPPPSTTLPPVFPKSDRPPPSDISTSPPYRLIRTPIYFDTGVYYPNCLAKAQMEKVLAFIRTHDVKGIRIGGYVANEDADDETYTAAEKLNLTRAEMVRLYLIQRGLDPELATLISWPDGARLSYGNGYGNYQLEGEIFLDCLEEASESCEPQSVSQWDFYDVERRQAVIFLTYAPAANQDVRTIPAPTAADVARICDGVDSDQSSFTP